MNEQSEVNLTEIFSVISKRSGAFFSLFLVIMFVTIIATILITPIYKASAKMIIQNENNIFPAGLVPVTTEDSVFLRTQKEIIVSNFIIGQALSSVQSQGLLKGFNYESIKKNVFAEYLSDSNVLDIQVLSENPKEAVELANSVVAVFVGYHKKDKITLLDKNLDIITKELGRVKKDIDGLGVRLRDLKDKDQLEFYQAQVPYYVNNILDLYKRNQLTQADILRLKEELLRTKDAMTSDQREFFYPNLTPDASASVDTIPLMDELKKKISDAQAKLSHLNVKYTQDYPEVIGVENEILSLKSSMDQELQKMHKAYNDYYAGTISFLEVQKKSGESEKDRNIIEMERLSRNIDKASLAQIEFNIISKFNDIFENIYAGFLHKQRDIELLKEQFTRSDLPNMRILELASIPVKRVRPSWPLNMALGVFFGLLFGICASLAEERKSVSKLKGMLQYEPASEKRSMRRVGKNSVVTYEAMNKSDQSKRFTTSANISGLGVCMRLRDNLDINTRLPLEIQVSNKDSVKATGKIIWKRASSAKDMFETGVSFEQIDSHEREKLINFLYGKDSINS